MKKLVLIIAIVLLTACSDVQASSKSNIHLEDTKYFDGSRTTYTFSVSRVKDDKTGKCFYVTRGTDVMQLSELFDCK